MVEKEKGCVYFFKHVGLTPVKIGFSTNESPLNRFDQFKTYAPFGAELIGFIRAREPLELETILHAKHSSKRLKGEWFEITKEEVQKDIEFYSNISDIEDMNNFQIEWAKSLGAKNEELKYNGDAKSYVISMYNKNANFNRTEIANKIGVSRMTIHRIINSYLESEQE